MTDQQSLRQLYSEDSEQQILGIAMIAPDALHHADIIQPKDMYYPYHEKMLSGLLELSSGNKPIDAVILHEYFEERNELHLVNGGLMYFVDLCKNVGSTKTITGHLKVVKDRSQERKLVIAARDIQDVMQESGLSTDDRVLEAKKLFDDACNSDNEKANTKTMQELSKEFVSMMEYRLENPGIKGVKFGLIDLDNKLQGAQPGDFIIIGARPGMGKTTMLCKAIQAACKDGNQAMCFSLEMPALQLTQRMVASSGNVPLNHLKDGTALEHEAYSGYTYNGIVATSNMSLTIDDQGGIDIADIRSRCINKKRASGLDAVYIDYLQLITDRTQKSRFDEVSSISRKLKILAKELEVPVIVLAQLSRSLEQRQDKRPMNSDLRESGQLEQDADVILFLYRDEEYDEGTMNKGILEIIIGKFRDGSKDTVYTEFKGATNQILDMPTGYRPIQEETKSYKNKGGF